MSEASALNAINARPGRSVEITATISEDRREELAPLFLSGAAQPLGRLLRGADEIKVNGEPVHDDALSRSPHEAILTGLSCSRESDGRVEISVTVPNRR